MSELIRALCWFASNVCGVSCCLLLLCGIFSVDEQFKGEGISFSYRVSSGVNRQAWADSLIILSMNKTYPCSRELLQCLHAHIAVSITQ